MYPIAPCLLSMIIQPGGVVNGKAVEDLSRAPPGNRQRKRHMASGDLRHITGGIEWEENRSIEDDT